MVDGDFHLGFRRSDRDSDQIFLEDPGTSLVTRLSILSGKGVTIWF